MKSKIICLGVLLAILLSSCGSAGNEAEELFQKIRGHYLEAVTVAGHGEITADYGQRVYAYEVDFTWSKNGETILLITEPENIAGAVAHISAGESALEFEGTMLETGAINSDGLTPIDCIPTLLRYAQEGFVIACGLETIENITYLHITCTDPISTMEENIQADLWFATDNYQLCNGEISVGGNTRLYCRFSEMVVELPSTEKENNQSLSD